MRYGSRKLFIVLLLGLFCVTLAEGQTGIQYDIVLVGGRVIDPETKMDAIRNVGI